MLRLATWSCGGPSGPCAAAEKGRLVGVIMDERGAELRACFDMNASRNPGRVESLRMRDCSVVDDVVAAWCGGPLATTMGAVARP